MLDALDRLDRAAPRVVFGTIRRKQGIREYVARCLSTGPVKPTPTTFSRFADQRFVEWLDQSTEFAEHLVTPVKLLRDAYPYPGTIDERNFTWALLSVRPGVRRKRHSSGSLLMGIGLKRNAYDAA